MMRRRPWVSLIRQRGIFDSRPVRDAVGAVLFLFFLAALVLAVAKCKPVEDPGAQARGAVHALAYGVEAADLACASIARSKRDVELARECAFARDAAKLSLEAADESLDMGHDDEVPCQVGQALAYARQMAGLIRQHGGKLPRALEHAFLLAPMFAEVCGG